jgi:hypothetical protein
MNVERKERMFHPLYTAPPGQLANLLLGGEGLRGASRRSHEPLPVAAACLALIEPEASDSLYCLT